jgi:hypothetical protein
VIKKKGKYFVLSAALLVFSILLASCQSMIASTDELNRQRAVDAWGANLTAQGESYLEEMEQASDPLMELSSDVPSEAEVMVDASSPGIEIQRTRKSRTIETVYTVTSDGPGWVVFHEDKDGEPGAVLEKISVNGGTNRIARTEVLQEMGSEPIHVMLHHDYGWVGYFEYPRTDGPVFVDDEMVNELCLCSY